MRNTGEILIFSSFIFLYNYLSKLELGFKESSRKFGVDMDQYNGSNILKNEPKTIRTTTKICSSMNNYRKIMNK